MRAGGKAPGNDEVARAAKASARGIIQLEIAFDLAARVPPIFEMQNVAMLQFMNERRIMNLHQLRIAVKVGQRDEQIERLTRGSSEARLSLALPIEATPSYISVPSCDRRAAA